MPYTALIAEDNPAFQLIMRTALEFVGYQVDSASNGAEAVELLRHKRFHLLLLDLNMPIMSGTAVLPIVRSMRACDSMHVIVVTANSHMNNSEVEDLADFVMMKPVNPEELARFAERLKESPRNRPVPNPATWD
jgi:CheY-like chemotaxis protein